MTDLSALKSELTDFYRNRHPSEYRKSVDAANEVLSREMPDRVSAFEQKARQYELLSELYTPTLFEHTSFYYELCSLSPVSGPTTAGNYTYKHNLADYRNSIGELVRERDYAASFPLYSFCGAFGDELYHFAMNHEPIFKGGFRSLYERAEARLDGADESEREFLGCMKRGLLAVKRVSERFAELAAELAEKADTDVLRAHYETIAETAARTPWEPPTSFAEALNLVSFIQSVIPALEGGLLCSMGRLDKLLEPFYRAELAAGTLTESEAYRLICEFLIVWDSHMDNDMKNQRSNYNSSVYTVGGCDGDGKPFCNELTLMLLRATHEHKLIFPKIKCRYSKSSPESYLAAIAKELCSGRSILLLQNDDTLIPALERAGISTADARNYSILGCWEPVIPDCTNEHCAYVNLLKILELSVFGDFNRDGIGLELDSISGSMSFDEVYGRVIGNIRRVLESRCAVASKARLSWVKCDPHLLISSAVDSCMEKRRDITDGGARYNLDELICAGLPNVIDSLLAIEELCFERRVCTLEAYLSAVRSDFGGEGESLRRAALKCRFYGDGSDRSRELTRRITDDIAHIAEGLPVAYGGRATVGYMLFMEHDGWAAKMRATPDGRKSGDGFARGLTPSVLHKISSVTAPFAAVNAVDGTKIAANSVMNLTLPLGKLPESTVTAFLRGCAATSSEALQLNSVSREELEDAVAHPELHGELVVRVCGFSARFINLSDSVKRDFLTRNVFELE